MKEPHCYAIRLVNPFTGLLQVVEHDMARGLSSNGFNWEIQVRVERRAGGWGSLNRAKTEFKYYRYGFWNHREGMTRLPVDPSIDASQLQLGYKRLLGLFRSGLLESLPFPLEDTYEYWLLDRQDNPLALLGSTCDRQMIPRIKEQRWHACSGSLNIEGYPQTKGQPLESLIRQHSGRRQWFHRTLDGSGVGLDYRATAALIGRELSVDVFPQLLLKTDWGTPEAQQLVDDWLEHMAPWLLQLQTLGDQCRHDLERAASHSPERVDALYRLYPKVMDKRFLKTARVSANIMRASEKQ